MRQGRRPAALLLAGAFWLAAGPAAGQDDWAGLPEDAGREEVYGICGACHSLMLVKQQGLDRETWAQTLVWMVEEQGMAELDTETLELVLDYLAEHYGVDSRGPQPGIPPVIGGASRADKPPR